MSVMEKAAYLKGLAEGLGVDPQSKEGRLWAALNELLLDMAREIEQMHEADREQAKLLKSIDDEISYLEELSGGFDSEDESGCGRCSGPCLVNKDDYDDEDSTEATYDGVRYNASCPVCGEKISFDEQTLDKGTIRCPGCGESLEFNIAHRLIDDDKPGDKPAPKS